MTLEAQIAALLAEAEPLRSLDDDDEAKRPLAGIVDEINRLRAAQAKQAMTEPPAAAEGADAKKARKTA